MHKAIGVNDICESNPSALFCGVFFILGVTMGWYAEHRRASHEKSVLVDQMLEADERLDGIHVGDAIIALGLIESGKTEAAVERLARPIAPYYTIYEGSTNLNARQLKLRGLVEDLARTNKTLARIIEEHANLTK